jgi:hypothetical protein
MSNFHQNKNFSFTLSIDNVDFGNVQRFNLPGITVGTIEQPTRFKSNNIPGDSILEDDLNITILLDEDFINYEQIRNLVHRTNLYSSDEQIDPEKKRFDIVIQMFNNSNKNIINFKYTNVMLENISDIDIDSNLEDDTDPLIFSIVGNFQEFHIERNSE